ncbi:PAC2 family protein [Canibacter sp. lx-72]|nr:PAC2 family protein [Canibacter zhuwentaonis]MBT1035145.1 PAC2 family protein [Canibacter zhuwentaonis]
MTKHLLENSAKVALIAEFNSDLLVDYRANRPEIWLENTQFKDFEASTISLYACSDAIGNNFLLLAGAEPNYRWQRFAGAVSMLASDLEVRVVAWLDTFPTPVPHTRPTAKIFSGTNKHFTDMLSDWRPKMCINSGIVHLLEERLRRDAHEVTGCMLMIPQYVSEQGYYPAGVRAGLSIISEIAGIIMSSEELIEHEEKFEQEISRRMAQNPEFAEILADLERMYDRFKEKVKLDSTDLNVFNDLPTPDELGQEVEKFLASDTEVGGKNLADLFSQEDAGDADRAGTRDEWTRSAGDAESKGSKDAGGDSSEG